MDRRAFLGGAGSCAAHLALAATLPPALTRAWIRPVPRVVAREPFGSLVQVADGIWALISTPLEGDRTTLSNGGLIAGSDGVLAIEGFFMPEGAAWLAARSQELTGRRPSHVALTHYHADHVNGLAGYLGGGATPAILATAATRDLVLERNTPPNAERAAALGGVTVLDPAGTATLDLGDRQVTITPRAGHTASDITLTVDDPHVVFCGDLVWNGMFPNYVDAVPSALSRAVRSSRGEAETVYVPGHGRLADQAAFDRYVEVIDAVEAGARTAFAAGDDAEAAGGAFTLPAALGEWTLFGRTYMARAFGAWYRELSGS